MSVSRETLNQSVSRETLERLQAFVDLLKTWNTRINLISPRDVPNVWARHVGDSLQLTQLIPEVTQTACDLGSGGGFPGLVLAIATGLTFTLIEADARKATFLREAARLTTAPITVVNRRIEATRLPPVDLITARALAPLTKLLELGFPLLRPGGTMLFLKGASAESEVADAQRGWIMHVERHISRTSESGVILRISEVQRA